jgi:hypothetical protein
MLLAAAALVVPGVPQAVDDQGFDTEPVSVADTNIAPGGLPQLVAVEVSHQGSFDRVVFRFSSHVPGYNISYVSGIRHDPSDKPIQLQGNAFISVAMHSVASGQVGAPAAPQSRQTPLFPQLRELTGAGDFEGVVSYGLGLTSRSGFRVTTLTNPDRLVVDVRITTLSATGTPTRELGTIAGALVLAGSAAMLLTRRRHHFVVPGQRSSGPPG